jgi:hypothetical protein
MKLLFINGLHHKNMNALQKYNNIEITTVNNTNLDNINLDEFDAVYSPAQPIDVSRYPNTKFIFGPHFSVFPVENQIALIKGSKNTVYVQPSEWVVDLWKSFPFFDINIKALPFGVDTEKFSEICPLSERNEVFIYFKRRKPSELNFIVDFLNKQNINYKTFNYVSSYSEDDYIKCLQNAKYGIWLDAHESQGFALQEALSCNVPLLVWNVSSLNQEYGFNYPNLPATSISYWDNSCGEYFYNENEFVEKFNVLNSSLDNYKPRQFILNNLSIKKCEEKFIDIINNI